MDQEKDVDLQKVRGLDVDFLVDCAVAVFDFLVVAGEALHKLTGQDQCVGVL
jgi:hypothetical protein